MKEVINMIIQGIKEENANMTKQERLELLVKCCQEYGNLLDNLFESSSLKGEDMEDAELTESTLWLIATDLRNEIESEVN